MMRIEHIALWTKDLERTKQFYVEYFGGEAGKKYCNEKTGFESYFIKFDSGARIELMRKPSIAKVDGNEDIRHIGYIHMAFSVGSKEKVDEITSKLREAGYNVVSEPRTTGDGYYESCVLDIEGNRVEITI